MSWDQFLVENGFGHTEFRCPSISKSQQKRRKFSVSECFVLRHGTIPRETNDSQLVLSKDLGANVIEGKPMSMGGHSVNLQLIQVVKIPTQKLERLVLSQNTNSILFERLKPNPRESYFVCASQFTRSMATIVAPATIQQLENPLAQIISFDENMFPNTEIDPHNESNQHSYEKKPCD